MRKFLGKLREAIAGSLPLAATLLLLFYPAVCHAIDLCSDHPKPTITSITPDVWFAGQTYNNVTIKGANLSSTVGLEGANCPVVISVNMDTGSVSRGINSQSSTRITATVMPDPSDPTETACVTAAVFNPLVVRAAESANATPAAGTAGSPCTDPDGNHGITVQILDNQIQCDPSMNCTQSVISTTDGTSPPAQDADVGQPIILTTPALPNGIKATKTIWTVGGTKIAKYNPTTGPTKVTPLTEDDLKKANITFYWVYPNSSSPVSIPVT